MKFILSIQLILVIAIILDFHKKSLERQKTKRNWRYNFITEPRKIIAGNYMKTFNLDINSVLLRTKFQCSIGWLPCKSCLMFRVHVIRTAFQSLYNIYRINTSTFNN